MSRISEGECDDTASFLRSCAFGHNIQQALRGKKGKKFLIELEAALLALPEKRLAKGVMSAANEHPDSKRNSKNDVCALGAVALKRAMTAGKAREEALKELADKFDPEESEWKTQKQAAQEVGISHPLAYAIIYRNDEYCHSDTPEKRYSRVLEWVQAKIAGEDTNSFY